MRTFLPLQLLLSIVAFAALALFEPAAAAAGWRVAFLTACGPVVGAVLMLAIARLTGADWPAFVPIAAAAPILALGAIGIGLIQVVTPAPAHIARWQAPLAVGVRSLAVVLAVVWARRRIAGSASVTWTAVFLALYASLVTIIGSDWMLGGTPGRAISAVGMILFVEEIGGACALVLLLGAGETRFRCDMGKMLAACALGLSYLVFMDYLILWYGDLPSRVGWYVVRSTTAMGFLVVAALGAGLGLPIAAQALIGGDPGRRIAGAGALAGLALLNLWWTDGGWIAAAAACLAAWLFTTGSLLVARTMAHG